MLVILGLDGLEYNYVEEFGFKELKQAYYGKTDISEFEKPRTLVIWSSFISGKNMEKEVLSQKDFWDFKVPIEKTLFSKFKNFKAIDVPGFCFDAEQHKKERQGLKEFFDKKISIEDYDKLIFTHHKKIKQEFFEALKKDYNVVMGYFGLADVVGHLSFGIKSKMKMIYQELDEIAKKTKEMAEGNVLIFADHGMEAIGRFGDHSNNGFWSTNKDFGIKNPKSTDFYNIITGKRI